MTDSTIKCSGHGLSSLLKDKGRIKGIEIGCSIGDTTEWLLQSLPDITICCVDPYTDYIDWNTNNLQNLHTQYSHFCERIINKYPERSKMFRMTSDEAVNQFEDESLDFIFIDGLHTYDQVIKDCINYYPKIKKGGLFAGHDYGVIEQVRLAVNDFRNDVCPDKTICFTDVDVWYWYK